MLKRSGTLTAFVLAAVLITACGSSSSKSNVSAGDTAGPPAPSASTTTVPFVQTAAQQPCVAVADPLPPGAPEVPVKVGPAPTTLVVEDLTPGTGAEVAATSTVTVDYIGVACSTGKIFDSSYKTGQPATFPLNGVIPGWSQGLVGMKVGGKRLLGIPSGLGFVVEMKSVS
jgi:peptidylprolyl isomerase